VALDVYLRQWTGETYRHLPVGVRFDVLNFRYAGKGLDNRWNQPGEPTLYLAGDIGVAIAEWARHIEIDRTPELEVATIERIVYRLRLTIDRVLDLRDPLIWAELSLDDAPIRFLDLPTARATAHFVRNTTEAQGMFVSCVPFIDQLERWCLVLFLDKLPAKPSEYISSVITEGPLRWR